MCFWVHDQSVLFSHLCKTIFTVQYIVYGIFLDISQIITTHYTTLLSCHQKKMLKIEHLLHTKLLFEISNLLYLTHSSYFFLNVFSHFGTWFPKESPWRHKKALKVHRNIVNIDQLLHFVSSRFPHEQNCHRICDNYILILLFFLPACCSRAFSSSNFQFPSRCCPYLDVAPVPRSPHPLVRLPKFQL